jgi:hypothetical protein
MANLPITSQFELSVDEFLTERFLSLGISDSRAGLRRQARNLNWQLEIISFVCVVLSILAVVALLVMSVGIADIWSGHTGSGNPLFPFAVFALAAVLLIGCIRAPKSLRHRRWLTRGRRYDIPDSEIFASLIQPLFDGTANVAILSKDGIGVDVTSTSRRAVQRYLSGRALQDRALPSLLLRDGEHDSIWRRRLGLAPLPHIVILRSAWQPDGGDVILGDVASSDLATISPVPPQPSKADSKDHWLCGISETDFRFLSRRVANRYTATQQKQVLIMLETAYAEFNRQPDMHVTTVKRAVCEALIKAQLPIGFDKPNADEWIEKMLARNNNTHPYRYVRRFMTEPGYVPPAGLRYEPELDFPTT